MKCTPGPNWCKGGGGEGTGSIGGYYEGMGAKLDELKRLQGQGSVLPAGQMLGGMLDIMIKDQQERNAQRLLEEEARKLEEARQAEEAAREAARRRDEIYNNLSGVLKDAETQVLALKGMSDSELRLKINTPTFEEQPPAVDLRHLDPNRPILVDPNMVSGKERQMPAQVSRKTLDNINYNRGYDAILAGDPAAAIGFFHDAQKELGDDLMVKISIAFAEDLAQVRREKQQENQAYSEAYKGIMSALNEDYITAEKQLEAATKLNPEDNRFKKDLEVVRVWKESERLREHLEVQAEKRGLIEENLHKLGAGTIEAIRMRDYNTAIPTLEKMLAMEDIQPTRELLDYVKAMRDQDLQKLGASTIMAVQISEYDKAAAMLEEMLSIEDAQPTRELLDTVRGWPDQ